MKLGRGERVTITLAKEERNKIEIAAASQRKTMAAYAREVLLKDADNVIKKSNKK